MSHPCFHAFVLFTVFLSLAPASAQTPPASAVIAGTVADSTGARVAGATVAALAADGSVVASTVTVADGAFILRVPFPARQIAISAPGFLEQRHTVGLMDPKPSFVLQLAGVSESVQVEGASGYRADQTRTAMRTPAALRDIPQALSIVTRSLIADQGMRGIGDVVRYMPGVGMAQGEGNRDTPVLRGNATTADFFVDGVRDDVQYVRDLYNIERVEAIKGPNAMMFGRGGVGGVINRVTRQADWTRQSEFTVQIGSWNERRISGDAGADVSHALSARVTGVYEDSGSYRDGVDVQRYGINPTAAFRLGPRTTLRAGYEYFHDARVADRGVSSLHGRPLETDPSLFFGDPGRSPVRATVNVGTLTFDHALVRGGSLRNRASLGVYDKFYQNVFPGPADAAAGTVLIQAYNNATDRRNVFNQTDLTLPGSFGRMRHTLLIGAEAGRQVTDNVRNTGHFITAGSFQRAVTAPIANPRVTLPLEFRQSATDADNHGIATTVAVYAQDQMTIHRRFDLIAGIRFDRFEMDFTNNRTGERLSSRDGLWSPRLGAIYRPAGDLSIYGSYTLSHLPRAGEQLSSLTAANRTLEPETFTNYEAGATWDVTRSLALTAAIYRLDRSNVAVADPLDPARMLLVDAQRTRGLEVGLNGHITAAWSVTGGYALQDGTITRSLSSSAAAGASLAQLPKHAWSLWNKYRFHPRVAAGLGAIHRGDAFTSTDNRVVLPSFTRMDAAVYVDLTDRLRAQVNVENLLDARYFAYAHSNTNITPGSPRAIRAALVVVPF